MKYTSFPTSGTGMLVEVTPCTSRQAGHLLVAGETRQRVALIFDVGLSTLYKKFPASRQA